MTTGEEWNGTLIYLSRLANYREIRAGKPKDFWKTILGFRFLRFLKGFFRFQCTNKAGHNNSTHEEHPVGYVILSVTSFS